MKCCLNSRLPKQIMPKADQIKFQYRDKNSIPDYIDYHKTIILDCYNIKELDWIQIKSFNKLCKEDFLLCLSNIDMAKQANSNNVKWYWGFPVTSMYEAKGLEQLGSQYLKLGAPLFFDLSRIKSLMPNMKFRHTPNVAYNDGLPRKDGVVGTWIRPEDIYLYDIYIDVIEFEDCDRDKEQELYRIYMETNTWRSLLSLLITNLNFDCMNRMIPKDMAFHRIDCQQKCQYGSNCKLCYRSLQLANPELIKKYADSQGLLSAT